MLIFREVEELVREVKDRIAWLGSEEDATWDDRRLEFLMRLVSYINKFSWLKHRALVAKVRTFLRTRYSYQAVAEEYGITVKQAHKAISYASHSLRSQIGGVVDLIRSGHFTAAEREFALLTGSMHPSTWFLKEVTDRFHPVKNAGVVLGTASRRELNVLRFYSKPGFDRAMAALDASTVQQILYILSSSDRSYLREKEWLYKCLIEDTATVDECIRALDDEFVWGAVSDDGASI